MEELSTFWIIGIVFNVLMFLLGAWWILRQTGASQEVPSAGEGPAGKGGRDNT